MQARDTMRSLRNRPPIKYVVFNRDQLHDILANNFDLMPIDRIKHAVLLALLSERCTHSDAILVFSVYAVDYHARRAMIDIKRSIMNTHELPDEVSFVTCRAGEDAKCWDWYGRSD